MKRIELNAETIYWTARTDWQRMHEDGRMEHGVNTFLPPFVALQKMAMQVARGELSKQRLWVEERHATDKERWDLWHDFTPFGSQLNLDCKIDYTGHPRWWIIAREPATDGLFSSGSYMAPDFALAWFIAVCWENHLEWMTEQLEVVGGLA
jgi:hypothetical protein